MHVHTYIQNHELFKISGENFHNKYISLSSITETEPVGRMYLFTAGPPHPWVSQL